MAHIHKGKGQNRCHHKSISVISSNDRVIDWMGVRLGALFFSSKWTVRYGTVRYGMYSMYRSYVMYSMCTMYTMYRSYGMFSRYYVQCVHVCTYVCTQYLIPSMHPYASVLMCMHSYASAIYPYAPTCLYAPPSSTKMLIFKLHFRRKVTRTQGLTRSQISICDRQRKVITDPFQFTRLANS